MKWWKGVGTKDLIPKLTESNSRATTRKQTEPRVSTTKVIYRYVLSELGVILIIWTLEYTSCSAGFQQGRTIGGTMDKENVRPVWDHKEGDGYNQGMDRIWNGGQCASSNQANKLWYTPRGLTGERTYMFWQQLYLLHLYKENISNLVSARSLLQCIAVWMLAFVSFKIRQIRRKPLIR